MPAFVNPRCACTARVTVVVLSVCLSTTILGLQATRRLMSDTNIFSATRALKIIKGSVEGPAGTANAVPLFLTVRRCHTTIF